MASLALPDEPDFEQLKTQAKDLKRAVRTADPAAIAEVRERDPGRSVGAAFSLSAAQRVVARRYGFAGWAALRQHVEFVRASTRFPQRMAMGDPVDLADEFLRLACLNYDGAGPAEWSRARALLLEHPDLSAANVYVATAAADVPALRTMLDTDPGAARREGGPYRWEPLCYLTYARHDPAMAGPAVLDAARLLLAAGADPNAGFLWQGLRSPFTALTGAFGEGEMGPVLQPRHPHSLALAKVLLQAGADPNDAQTLYNRMFEPGNDHLELLFEFGLGAGDGGPWKRRLGAALPTPAEMVRADLDWAITHGMVERVRLLLEHGVDVTSPFDDGSTPTQKAVTTGHPELVEHLVARGATGPELSPAEALAAAVLAGDRATVAALEADHPGLAQELRASRPGLPAWAATTGRPAPLEILVGLGFDINAKGRTDVPSNQPWQTALHHAAREGDLELARTLLRLGADPQSRDKRFDATPLGWARHANQPALVELLEPVTAPGE